MSKFASAAVVVVASVVAHHGPAAACSLLIPTVQQMRFSVQDGDVVPRNLVLYSNFYGAADGSSWWLTSFGRAPQQLIMTFPASERGAVTLATAEPLLPSTSYTLRWSADDAPPLPTTGVEDDNGDGQPDDFSARITFTTSSDDDTSAPAAPTASHETETTLPYEGCSGDWHSGSTWARFFITPNDDDAVAMYVLRDVDGAVLDASVTPFSTIDDNGDIFVSETAEEGGTKTYQIVAIDHAGNESEPTVIDVGLGCPGSCSSADVTGVSALTGLLLLLRRRRRHHEQSR
jgi:uncharacterized protein (TIGR03382 family)